MPMGDVDVIWRSTSLSNLRNGAVANDPKIMYGLKTGGISSPEYFITFYSSFDGGVNWTTQQWTRDTKDLNTDMRCSADGNFIAILTDYEDLIISLDRGVTWTERYVGGLIDKVFETLFTSNNFSAIYISDNYIYRSIDIGGTFQIISPPAPSGRYHSVVANDEGSVVYALNMYDPVNYYSNIVRSFDAGKTWDTISGRFLKLITNSTGQIILARDKPTGYYEYLRISYDYGATWRNVYILTISGGGGTIQRNIRSFVMSDDGRVIIFSIYANDGNYAGTFRSNDFGYTYNYEPDIGGFIGYNPQYLVGNKNLNGMIAYNPTAITGAPSMTWVYSEP